MFMVQGLVLGLWFRGLSGFGNARGNSGIKIGRGLHRDCWGQGCNKSNVRVIGFLHCA